MLSIGAMNASLCMVGGVIKGLLLFRRHADDEFVPYRDLAVQIAHCGYGYSPFRQIRIRFSLFFRHELRHDGCWLKNYLINASWNVLVGIIMYLCFPETKGPKLEEVSRFFDGLQLVEA
ncbi:uncharacterized protein BCR38DRAFT_44364 [Pseudomassariella vexata]|uniref:Uncharacterized protein n=1 Tax=Pseudomassariella vexata TaxID=1141098 RepID=A0A1Y2DN44_9PEZI|nr:uncharacterized protein BCR38DRAFT_44364 [Pseudomassariella vexata]ORY60670.1 hypothetical protein BCR38DRAFT_44364 [Pseudomassariella vexata]